MSDTETHLKQNYIGGQWVDSKGGKLHDVINPATEEAASTVVLGTAADVDDAVAAHRAVDHGAAIFQPCGCRIESVERLFAGHQRQQMRRVKTECRAAVL